MGSNATRAYRSTISSSTTQNGTYTAIAQTIDLQGPSPEVGEIDITNNDSPDNTKEYIPGLIEPGEIEFEVIYKKAQCATLYGMFGNDTIYWFKETWPDGSFWNFPGFLKSFGTEGETDDGTIMNTIGIKLTGKPTFTAGS